MKKTLAAFLLILSTAMSWAQTPNDLFQQAMLDMFDGRWEQALEKLEKVESGQAPQELKTRSYFFSARAMEKSGKTERALKRYEDFLAADYSDAALRKEAGFARVKLASQLYRAGNREYSGRVVDALDSQDAELRFLAAVQLSYFQDRDLRLKAVPVLRETLAGNPDDEVRNQAALAMLRIDPKLLEKETSGAAPRSAQNLHLLIHDREGGEIKLALPVSLARLALGALPENAKEELRKEGINPDNILETLSKAGEILEVRSDGSTIKLWID